MTSAESAYLFRHALMRNAAYELQLPGDRAKLHELAYLLIEQAFGGKAPDPPPLDSRAELSYQPHDLDSVAAELALHARLGGLVAQQPAILRRAAEHAERTHAIAASLEFWRALAATTEGAERAWVQWRSARLAFRVGRQEQAQELIAQALSAAELHGDSKQQIVFLIARSIVSQGTSDHSRCVDDCTRALALAQQAGEDRALASVYNNLGNALKSAKRFAESEGAYRQAMEATIRSGDEPGLAIALTNLAGALSDKGEHQQALEQYDKALELFRRTGVRRSEGVVVLGLGVVLRRVGRLEESDAKCAQALAIMREVGDRRFEAAVTASIALGLFQRNLFEAAAGMFEQARALHRDCGDRRSEGDDLNQLGNAAWSLGRDSAAHGHYEQAVAVGRQVRDNLLEASGMCGMACTLLAIGDTQGAQAAWQSGRPRLEQLGDLPLRQHRDNQWAEAHRRAGLTPPAAAQDKPSSS